MAWPLTPNVAQQAATGVVSTGGDNTLVSAPGAGKQIVVSALILQNESSTATTMILKAGATALLRCLGQNQGDGVALVFPGDRPLLAGENRALVLNLSGANACGYSVVYCVDAL